MSSSTMHEVLPSIVTVLALSIIFYNFSNAIYQCFVSPLRAIPGPRSNAASFFWLWLWDVKGTAVNNVKRLHVDYGSVVRIAPNEISIDDHDVHNGVLYSSGTNFMKAPYFYSQLAPGTSPNIFATGDRQLHSTLRRNMSKSFSRRSVLESEPFIRRTLETLSGILDSKCKTSSSFDLSKMSRCLSLQYIAHFAYDQNWDTIKLPDFDEPLLEAFDAFSRGSYLFTWCPPLRHPARALLSLLPGETSKALPTMTKAVDKTLKSNAGHEKVIKEDPNFISLLEAMQATMADMNQTYTREAAISDGVGIIFAGTDTTSTTLTFTILNIFSSPQAHERLYQELKRAMPDPNNICPLSELETLPYLTACVKEGLRISTPLRSRLPRVCPPGGWKYKQYDIPAGTIVSSSPYLQNYRESVFPDPGHFKPERWLCEDPAELKRMEQNFATFSKGSRICTGIQLATAEIYLTIAVIIRRFKLKEKNFDKLEHSEFFGLVIDSPVTVVFSSTED